MTTYKITNITNLLGKRENKYNSALNVEYIDSMMKKVINIKPNDSVYLTVGQLPLSVHKLRIKNLITVVEVSANELASVVSSKKKVETKIIAKDNLDIELHDVANENDLHNPINEEHSVKSKKKIKKEDEVVVEENYISST